MGGLSLMLLRGHERTSAFLAALPFFVLAVLSQPKRTIVDGKEIVEPVVFGHVVPMWTVFVILGIAFVALWRSIHRFLERRWPEMTTVTVDKVYNRPDGGFVAWKGDDPEAGSPMDYVVPQLRTALDFFRRKNPPPFASCCSVPKGPTPKRLPSMPNSFDGVRKHPIDFSKS